MIKKSGILALAITCLLHTAASAQAENLPNPVASPDAQSPRATASRTDNTAGALTPAQLLRAMQQSYPPLQITREKVKQNQAKLLEKQGAFDTTLKGKAEVAALGYYQYLVLDTQIRQPTPLWGTTFFTGYRLGNGKIPDYYGKKETLSLGEFNLGVEIPLLQNGPIDSRRADIQLLELAIDASELDILNKQLKFAKTALKAYWSWRVLHEKQTVAEELLQRARIKVDQLKAEVEVGKTAPIYVTENQRSIYKRQQKLLDIQKDRQLAALDMQLFLPPEQQRWSIPDGLPLTPNCDALPQAVTDTELKEAQNRRPETLQLALQQRQNDIAKRLADNFQWPALDLYFELSQDFGEGSKSKEQFEAMGGVNFYYPPALRKARGQILRLESIERALQAELQFAYREIAQEIGSLVIERRNSCQQAYLAAQEVEVARKVAAAERERFQLGNSTLFTVNLLEEAVAEARLRHLDALKVYLVAESLYPITLGLLPQG